MVGEHVAEGGGGFGKGGGMVDGDGFGGGDLHVVDVIAIPERLDDVVGKTENQNVLDGLFARVVISAVDLICGECVLWFYFERASGLQIVAKGLFDDDGGPVAALFLGEAGLTELFRDGGEESRSHSEVEKLVATGVVLVIGVGDLLREALVSLRVLKITFDVINALGKPGPGCRVDFGGGIFGDFLGEGFSKALGVEVLAGEADDGKVLGDDSAGGEIAECGDELALGQVAGGAEDDHDAGSGYGVCVDMVHERVSCLGFGRGADGCIATPVKISFPRDHRIGSAWRKEFWKRTPLRRVT